jgi:hypothetical protein
MTEGEVSEVFGVVGLSGAGLATVPDTVSPTTIVQLGRGTCVMTAELTGNGFEIDPSGPREQSLVDPDVSSLTWTWQVRPIRSGSLELKLHITPIQQDDSKSVNGAVRTYEVQIAVRAKPDDRSASKKLNDFLREPLPATVLAILVAGISAKGIAVWIHRRRTNVE